MLARNLETLGVDQKTADLISLDALQRNLRFSLAKKNKDNDQNYTRTDIPAALELLTRATGALDLIQKRASDTEAWALDTIGRLKDDLAAAEARASTSEERVRATELVAQNIQIQLSSAEERASHAEQGLKKAEERVSRAEERAGIAEAWLAHVQNVITYSLSSATSILAKLKPDVDVVAELENKVASISRSTCAEPSAYPEKTEG